MKGDVGMPPHEKEREQKDAHLKTEETHPTPSLHFCSSSCKILPTQPLRTEIRNAAIA